MNKWEAQYHAICLGITDKEVIKNAERLVESAIRLSEASRQPLGATVGAMLTAARHFDNKYRPVDLSLDRHPCDY